MAFNPSRDETRKLRYPLIDLGDSDNNLDDMTSDQHQESERAASPDLGDTLLQNILESNTDKMADEDKAEQKRPTEKWAAVNASSLITRRTVAYAARSCKVDLPTAEKTLSHFKALGWNMPLDPRSTNTDTDEFSGPGSHVLANRDVPWSTFICGVQGAGKSHTVCCLLENALLQKEKSDRVDVPLAAIVFHYDSYTRGLCSQVCEAAYLCSAGIPVTVLVSPSNVWAMTEIYENLPDLPEDVTRPRVYPLYLSEASLTTETILKLMAVDPTAEDVPLYVDIVNNILREMGMEKEGAEKFSYRDFRRRLDDVKWLPGQRTALNLRLQMLDACLEPSEFTTHTKPANTHPNMWTFQPGTITIVDLSDVFISPNDACAMFSICLSRFMEDRLESGRLVALDEAHKFLRQSGAAKALTEDLCGIIRQQRHTGTRVLIATQEPTLGPELIGLCQATFVHRIESPIWYDALKQALAPIREYDNKYYPDSTLLNKIMSLWTGEAFVFCPQAKIVIDMFADEIPGAALNPGFTKISVRSRKTFDGGKTVRASNPRGKNYIEKPINRYIPMYVVNKPPPTQPKGKGAAAVGAQGKQEQMPATRAKTTPAVAQGSIAPQSPQQPNPQGTSPSDKALRKQARALMRENLDSGIWKTQEEIKWGQLIVDLESYYGVKRGAFGSKAVYVKLIKAAATEEFHCWKKSQRK